MNTEEVQARLKGGQIMLICHLPVFSLVFIRVALHDSWFKLISLLLLLSLTLHLQSEISSPGL